MERLDATLRRVDGRGYKAYKDLRGRYRFDSFTLEVIHVQGDPFAAPSRLAVEVPLGRVPLPAEEPSSQSRRVGYEDALLRSLHEVLGRMGGRRRGSGHSGVWGLVQVGQEMLPRTACEVGADRLIVRLTAGLPARGRRILGRQAHALFFEDLPVLIEDGILGADPDRLEAHADANEDQDALRGQLGERGWVAFLADGAVLPRRSGVDDRPLDESIVPWRTPPELEATVDLPNAGVIRGAGIPAGVTLICGGGYHGKSTVLDALARSVYNHIPGDGRHACATLYEAVSVRAEDGRSVSAVDISPFIDDLPDGRSTTSFHTQNASGSTSQAANIVEALELGARCLLIDEDTSATNFMVRDRRMQELIAADREPIAPFIDRVTELNRRLGVSTVLVVGGAGDYFDVADQVIVMDHYEPRVETERARRIAQDHPSNRLAEPHPPIGYPAPRVPAPRGLDPSRGRRAERVRAREGRTISFGEQEVEIGLLAQLVDDGQARTIGDWMLACARRLADGDTSLAEIGRHLEERGWEELSACTARGFGDRVMARRFELAAALNRLRTLEIVRSSGPPARRPA